MPYVPISLKHAVHNGSSTQYVCVYAHWHNGPCRTPEGDLWYPTKEPRR